MKISYEWLKDLVPGLDLEPEEVAQRLALRGAPVEGTSSPGEGLGDVIVARVEEAGPHPNADRLSLCKVDAGGGIVQVVCGAPNARSGGWYPFAPVGATLPGDFRIEKRKIRGEVSEGMLCSPKELGLGPDHSGILEIHGEFTPGQGFVEALGLGDVTLDVEVTSNRGDLLSHVGVARELASEGAGEVRLAEVPDDPGVELTYEEGAPEVEAGGVRVRIDAPDLCHRYMGAIVRGVRVGPSPAWLQERLRGAGVRPINSVVDATNYVMLELGQPLHAFDLAKLAGPAIVVRRPKKGERTFTTLDGEERELGADMCLICDAEAPVAVGGVMGGLDSEVSGDTTDVLLECALFAPGRILKTRKALGMSTDASYRFERGVDPDGLRAALERAVAVVLATAGGEVDGAVLDCNPVGYEPAVVPLRLARIERVLGVRFEADAVEALLLPLGFEVVGEDDATLRVRVPGHRSYDVTREIDLIEEVARTHGYDRFPAELGAYRPGTVPDDPHFRLQDEVRALLVTLGLFEAHTPAFVPEGEGDVRVANPLNAREPYVRRTLLPSLLRRVEHNLARGNRDVRLFEIGTSFRKSGRRAPPAEATHVAVALTGRRRPPHWSEPDLPLEVWDLEAVLEAVVRKAYRGTAVVQAGSSDSGGPFDADIVLGVRHDDGTSLGSGGRIAEDAVDAPVWAGDVWGFELRLAAEPAPVPPVAYSPLPRHPAVERDLALLVFDAVTAAEVRRVIEERADEILEDVELFDRFVGEGVPAGMRSLAFRLRFRAPDRTLKDKEVDRIVKAVVRRLEEELGVRQRG